MIVIVKVLYYTGRRPDFRALFCCSDGVWGMGSKSETFT